jgi:hypothetical protein
VNNAYRELLGKNGMKFSGLSPDGNLVEIIELPDHPWYLGCQFHPELKSRPCGAPAVPLVRAAAWSGAAYRTRRPERRGESAAAASAAAGGGTNGRAAD